MMSRMSKVPHRLQKQRCCFIAQAVGYMLLLCPDDWGIAKIGYFAMSYCYPAKRSAPLWPFLYLAAVRLNFSACMLIFALVDVALFSHTLTIVQCCATHSAKANAQQRLEYY